MEIDNSEEVIKFPEKLETWKKDLLVQMQNFNFRRRLERTQLGDIEKQWIAAKRVIEKHEKMMFDRIAYTKKPGKNVELYQTLKEKTSAVRSQLVMDHSYVQAEEKLFSLEKQITTIKGSIEWLETQIRILEICLN